MYPEVGSAYWAFTTCMFVILLFETVTLTASSPYPNCSNGPVVDFVDPLPVTGAGGAVVVGVPELPELPLFPELPELPELPLVPEFPPEGCPDPVVEGFDVAEGAVFFVDSIRRCFGVLGCSPTIVRKPTTAPVIDIAIFFIYFLISS